MAKQNPATDPVSAAMSAIESALNLTDDDEAALASDASASPPPLAAAKPTAATPVLKPSAPAGERADAPSPWSAATAGRPRERSEAGYSRGDASK